MENNWYVYNHVREDKNEIFYIGIGYTKNYKRAYESRGRSEFWSRISNKTNWHSEIIFDNLSELDAKNMEIKLIKEYGKIKNGGVLCNITDGGDGTSGLNHSTETKSIIKEKRSKQVFSDDTKKIWSLNRLGNTRASGCKHSDEKRDKKSINQRGKFGGKVSRKDVDGFETIFDGVKEAADSIGITYTLIWYACSKRSDKLYKGYYWKYISEKQEKNNKDISMEYLYQKYVVEKLSGDKIAKELNCSGNKIYRLLKIYELM